MCYNPSSVNYSKSVLLYQDEPAYGLLLKLIILIVPVALLAASIYVWLETSTEQRLIEK